MVDRIQYDCGIGSLGDRSDTGEFRVKESSKKRRRPGAGPHRIKLPPSLQKNLLSLQLGSFSNNLVTVIPKTCQRTV